MEIGEIVATMTKTVSLILLSPWSNSRAPLTGRQAQAHLLASALPADLALAVVVRLAGTTRNRRISSTEHSADLNGTGLISQLVAFLFIQTADPVTGATNPLTKRQVPPIHPIGETQMRPKTQAVKP